MEACDCDEYFHVRNDGSFLLYCFVFGVSAAWLAVFIVFSACCFLLCVVLQLLGTHAELSMVSTNQSYPFCRLQYEKKMTTSLVQLLELSKSQCVDVTTFPVCLILVKTKGHQNLLHNSDLCDLTSFVFHFWQNMTNARTMKTLNGKLENTRALWWRCRKRMNMMITKWIVQLLSESRHVDNLHFHSY